MWNLNLRVRIFLFFAFLMIVSVVVVGSAIYIAHQSESDRLPRLLATYTGIATVVIVLMLLLVWQLFDRYVASALQSLARQMQTALHTEVQEGRMGLQEHETYQYLGSVSDAADELIKAYQNLKSEHSSGNAGDNAHAIQARQLAAILRDLDIAVLVMNRQHEILLYNQRALQSVNQPEFIGLARSALLLLEGSDLLVHANQVLEYKAQAQSQVRREINVRLKNDERKLQGSIGPVFNDEGLTTGYVLMFDVLPAIESEVRSPVEQHSTSLASDTNTDDVKTISLPSRPEFYDFDLFDRAVPANLEHRTLRSLDYVVFDTETTGLNPSNGDQMISIAAVRVVNGRVITGEYFDELIRPSMSVPEKSTVFHGITDDMLVNKPGIQEVLPRFERFVGDAVLVAHNAAFDMKFIELQSAPCEVSFDNTVLDTVLLSAFTHDHSSKHTLDDLAERYGIEIKARHTALGDSLATAHVFVKLLEQMACRNINTLSEAISASNKMTHIKRYQKAY